MIFTDISVLNEVINSTNANFGYGYYNSNNSIGSNKSNNNQIILIEHVTVQPPQTRRAVAYAAERLHPMCFFADFFSQISSCLEPINRLTALLHITDVDHFCLFKKLNNLKLKKQFDLKFPRAAT